MTDMFKLNSSYKTYIWGGTKIREVLKKRTDDLQCIAESWEISTHPAGESTIINGEFAGKTLREYFDITGWDIIGEYGREYRQLPILVKYIDAQKNLSIQVHPNEEYARRYENESGKSEVWFVIEAEKGAFLYLGFNRDISPEEVSKRIEDNTLEEVLNKINVKRGDVFYVPAGTVHAIGAGCLICEIQQSSDTTYRLYDYGRKDADGNRRPLHIAKALDVLNYEQYFVTDGDRRDISKAGEYLSKVLPLNAQCTLFNYEAEGEFKAKFPLNKVVFAVIYRGKGKLSSADEEHTVSVGDVWMACGNSVRVSGKCHALLIGI